MASHSSTLAWKIPWTEGHDSLQVHGVPKSWTQLSNFSFSFKAAKDNCVFLLTVVRVLQVQQFVCMSGARPKDHQRPWFLVWLWMSALGHVTPTKLTLPPFPLMVLLVHFPTHFYKIRANATKCFDSSH